MTVESFPKAFQRLLDATHSKTDAALASALGIKAQSVSQAKKKQQIPAQWIVDVATKYGVSADWLLFGEKPPLESGQKKQPHTINSELLAEAISAVEKGLIEVRHELEFDKKIELIVAVYDWFEEEGRANQARVIRFIKAIA